jgi:2-C-methyl-D-erythritol 4-phosphate cytidylyltransferase/2-C-methyl-D-erythritol 2,4-cyclodiphosphate synthase
MAAEAGLRLCHVDMTVISQKPKLAPHADAIRRNVARLLDLPLEHVAFKATTEEKLGFTGELKGLKAVALVSAVR